MHEPSSLSRRRVCLIGCLVVGLPCCLWPVFDPGTYQPYESWYSIGPVQVLGGPDEVWVFAEKQVMVYIPGRLVSAPVRSIGHIQEVLVFDEKGEKSRIVLPANGPTFHSNIGRIFRRPDGFYLIQGESMGYACSLYRWAGDRFQLLPLEESEAWLKRVGWDGASVHFDPALDRMTAANGWAHLYDDKAVLLLKEGVFVWKDRQLRFKAGKQDTRITYDITSADPQKPLTISVLAFDEEFRQLTGTEHRALHDRYRGEYGHRKP